MNTKVDKRRQKREEVVVLLSCEVSLYPLDTPNGDEIIMESIQALDARGLEHEVGPVSTYFVGNEDEVWQGLRELFERARQGAGEVSLVATVKTL